MNALTFAKRLSPLALLVAVALPMSAQAHKAWIVPSTTVLSGDEPFVTFDAAISNNLYYPDHAAMRLESMQVTGPNGEKVEIQNAATGRHRSVFDVQLKTQGTYRIANVNSGLMATWEENGQPKRWRGSEANFAKEVPADAKNLRVSRNAGRTETFVTSGSPTTDSLKPTGVGLEMAAITHPNDLFAGEAASFQLLIDGEPAQGVALEIVPGATRYRDAQNEIKVTTDAEGKFSVTWPAAGMYWLEASLQDEKAVAPATSRRATYVATLEVLPQ